MASNSNDCKVALIKDIIQASLHVFTLMKFLPINSNMQSLLRELFDGKGNYILSFHNL